MATKKAEKNTIQKTVNNFKSTVGNLHDGALNATDTLVDNSLKTGAKWQKIMVKAIEGGTDLFAKQQDLVLDTLEELKGQSLHGTKRFRNLIGLNNTTKTKKPRRVKQKVEATTQSILDAAVKSDKNRAKDDLKVIDGIGPKLEKMLNTGGYFTYDQLATANNKDLKILFDAAGPLFRSYNPVTLKQKAKKAAEGKLTK